MVNVFAKKLHASFWLHFNATLQPLATRIKICVIIQIKRERLCLSLFIWSMQDSNPFKCNSPVDCCLPLARRRQHLNFCPTGKNANRVLSPAPKIKGGFRLLLFLVRKQGSNSQPPQRPIIPPPHKSPAAVPALVYKDFLRYSFVTKAFSTDSANK